MMMTRDGAEARGRRALAAGFGWAVGCVRIDADGWAACLKFPHHGPVGWVDGSTFHEPSDNDVPDFRDPATVGVLFAQVEERLGAEVVLVRLPTGWRVVAARDPWHTNYGEGPSRVDALLAALEVGR